ncbi:hypothetical protein D3C75_1253670 [compost metagenome]
MQGKRLQAAFGCGNITAVKQIVEGDPEPHQGGDTRVGPGLLLFGKIALQPVGHFMALGIGLQTQRGEDQ